MYGSTPLTPPFPPPPPPPPWGRSYTVSFQRFRLVSESVVALSPPSWYSLCFVYWYASKGPTNSTRTSQVDFESDSSAFTTFHSFQYWSKFAPVACSLHNFQRHLPFCTWLHSNSSLRTEELVQVPLLGLYSMCSQVQLHSKLGTTHLCKRLHQTFGNKRIF